MYKKSSSSCCSYECGTLCIASYQIFCSAISIPIAVYFLVMSDEIINLPQFQDIDPQAKDMLRVYFKPIASAVLTVLIIELLIFIMAIVGIAHKRSGLMFPYIFKTFTALVMSFIFLIVLFVVQWSAWMILGQFFAFAINCYVTFVIYKCYKQIKYGKTVEEDKELMIVD